MSEHRRKPPQPQGGGRAAARRAAPQPSDHRAAPTGENGPFSPAASHGEERPYGGRAEARRAAKRGGRRRGEPDAAGGGGRGGRGGRRGGGAGHHDHGGGPRKRRLVDYPRYDKDGWRRWLPSWKLVSGITLGFLGVMMGAAALAYAWVDVPDPRKAAEAENNVYFWADGTQMAATGGEVNRQNVGIEQIPDHMQNAVKSAENKTFDDDSGIDPKGISRALVNMAKGQQTQGGSTITQQYVKNAMLGDQSQTISRKFKELFISIKVGNQIEKPQIMAGYLNTSYFGRNAYGIQAAARTYLDTDASKLTVAESAFLTTLLKGATYYDPAGATDLDPAATREANLKRVTDRWNWVLDEMVKDGHLDAAERKNLKFPDVEPPSKQAKLGGQVGYLVDLAKANFLANNKDISVTDLSLGGYQIHTTFDKKLVKDLEASVKKVYDKNIDPEKRPKTDTNVQFGGASVEPGTGAIRAIYGGADATKHFTNNSDNTGAQVGSTFKPYVLAAAMTDGVRDPGGPKDQPQSQRTRLDPDRAIYNGKNKLKIKNYDGSIWRNEQGNEWLQVNDGDTDYENINLREAMIDSANSPFVQLGMDIGIPQVREAAVKAGLLESSLDKGNVPSFSIGISTPSAIRMASSYGTFAAEGKQRDPYSVDHVKKNGRVIYQHEDDPQTAFPPNVANNVTDILVDVVEKGTGKNARLPGRDVAGKTGTTDGNRSAWFVGYTPQLSTAIDMYRLDDNEKNTKREFEKMFGTGGQDKIHGSSFPSDIFADFMGKAMKGKKVLEFTAPGPVGEAYWGGGASSPPPSKSKEPSDDETTKKPSEDESTSDKPESPASSGSSPDASASCNPWEDWTCGTNNGGDNEGANGNGANGANGANGNGANGANGANGNGANGANGGAGGNAANGGNGANGANNNGGNGNNNGGADNGAVIAGREE
ncbi:transglycosylase domain-containing protein [Streptomyces sp. NPDC058953]|uniref:transglycosylase domain-containing protein n=1 Tax=unclassified Streptomyces TaxID=2593676 RepID=UPI0036B0889F